MQEYVVNCQGKWWHFFIKPFYGLCYRKREAGRFLNFEVLLSGIQTGFGATVVGDSIHLVCQDETGRILYLTMEDEEWKKSVLLESKSLTSYPKHFRLLPVGKFINLFYIICYQEKTMLVHQTLGVERPPVVIDRITPRMPMFLAERDIGNDIAVYYENENGTSGFRILRWSQKSFGRFVPVNPSLGGCVCCALTESDGRVHYGAFQAVESFQNLVCFSKTETESFTQATTVNLDCPRDAMPVFYRDQEKLYLSWCENGCVLSSYSTDGGQHFTKPVRYMMGSSVVPVLYTVCNRDEMYQAYGFEREQEIVFCLGSGLFDTLPPTEKRVFRPEGYEVEDFAKQLGATPAEPEEAPENPLIDSLQKAMSSLKEQVFTLRRMLAELSERLELLEQLKAGDREESTQIKAE